MRSSTKEVYMYWNSSVEFFHVTQHLHVNCKIHCVLLSLVRITAFSHWVVPRKACHIFHHFSVALLMWLSPWKPREFGNEAAFLLDFSLRHISGDHCEALVEEAERAILHKCNLILRRLSICTQGLVVSWMLNGNCRAICHTRIPPSQLPRERKSLLN